MLAGATEIFQERPTDVNEFFGTQQQHGRKGSLASIAAQKILVRRWFGSVAFLDDSMEREWRTCAAAHSTSPCV